MLLRSKSQVESEQRETRRGRSLGGENGSDSSTPLFDPSLRLLLPPLTTYSSLLLHAIPLFVLSFSTISAAIHPLLHYYSLVLASLALLDYCLIMPVYQRQT